MTVSRKKTKIKASPHALGLAHSFTQCSGDDMCAESSCLFSSAIFAPVCLCQSELRGSDDLTLPRNNAGRQRSRHLIRLSMLRTYSTYACSFLAIWCVHTVCAAAFDMLIHLHSECLSHGHRDRIHLTLYPKVSRVIYVVVLKRVCVLIAPLELHD